MLEHERCQSQVSVMKQHLLFVHAWSGCDSTSAILGKGKPSFFQFVEKYPTIQSAYGRDEGDLFCL